MHLLRCLVFYAAIYQFDFRAEHLPGSHNLAADALSRNNLTLFSSLVSQMQQVAIPHPARDLLVETTPNWGSHKWTILFRNSLNRGSPRPPLQCTGQAGATTSNSAAPLPTPPLPLRGYPLPVCSHDVPDCSLGDSQNLY